MIDSDDGRISFPRYAQTACAAVAMRVVMGRGAMAVFCPASAARAIGTVSISSGSVSSAPRLSDRRKGHQFSVKRNRGMTTVVTLDIRAQAKNRMTRRYRPAE